MNTEWLLLSGATIVVFGGMVAILWTALAPRGVSAWTSSDGQLVTSDPLARPIFPKLYAILLGVIFGFVGMSSTGLPIMAIAGAWAGWSLPQSILDSRYSDLLFRLDRQLVEVVRDLNEGMAAGMNLAEAVEHTAKRTKAPMDREVARVGSGLRMGERAGSAFTAFANRINTDMSRRLAEAISIGLRFGGALKSTLENLERQMTERFQAFEKREAKTRSARKNAKVIAGAVPVMIVIYLIAMGPAVQEFYSSFGGTMVLIVVMAMVVGAQRWADRIAGDSRNDDGNKEQEAESND